MNEAPAPTTDRPLLARASFARDARRGALAGVAGATLVIALLGGLDAMSLSALVAAAIGVAAVAAWGSRSMDRAVSDDLARVTFLLRDLGRTFAERATDLDDAVRAPRTQEATSGLTGLLAKLEPRFDEVAAAERSARTALENAERARGILFAGISHDLKGPLNALLGFADLLALEELTPGQRESLEIVSSRGRELVALVETILDSARVEMGQLGISPRRVRLDEILEEASRKANELVHVDTGIEVIIDERLPSIDADPIHLTRALALVIAHALKASATATPAGGISRVEKPIATERVVVRARGVGQELRVDVEHKKSGPTAAALEELYFSNRRGRGLRLGLRLARTIFELHGGHIEVLERTNGRPSVACFLPVGAEGADSAHSKSVP